MKKLCLTVFLLILILCTLTACSEQSASEQFFAMDTVMSITCYGKNAEDQLKTARDEIYRLDRLLNAEASESDLSKLNRGETPTEETLTLAMTALRFCAETEGAFDITLQPASRLWGFSGENEYHIPSEEDLLQLQQITGYEKVTVAEEFILLPDGMSIDLGGIAKGYASDRLAELLHAQGAESAVISLGGNVLLMGSRPDGKPFTVGIQDPNDPSAIAFSITASDTSVITSGSYQRYFEENGIRYHHIMDPDTLSPAESGLLSVTVICENGTYADALSTALFVMGREKAIDFWQKQGNFSMILMDEKGDIYYTADLSPRDLSNGRYVYHKISEKS